MLGNRGILGVSLALGSTAYVIFSISAVLAESRAESFRDRLSLEPEKVAVFIKQSSPTRDVNRLRREIGEEFKGSSIDESLPTFWSVKLKQSSKSESAISAETKTALNRLSNNETVSFITPTFLSESGSEIIPRPDYFCRFDSEDSETQIINTIQSNVPGREIEKDAWSMNGVYRVKAAEFKNGFDYLEALQDLEIHAKYCEPDVFFQGTSNFYPNDEGFDQVWGVHNTGQSGGMDDADMDGPEAWDISMGDPNVIVAIFDSGVQQDHPDINQIPGIDVTNQGGDGGPIDLNFDRHGTAVAGCISGMADNVSGTVGIAPHASIVSIRHVIAYNTSGDWVTATSWTVDALSEAQALGAKITNNSNSYGFTSSLIEDKYDQTAAEGMIHFASSGNNFSLEPVSYPANIASVNAIGGITRMGEHYTTANTGPEVAFAAPGSSIYTTDLTGTDGYSSTSYATKSGTSFSSPYAAGVAALILSVDPNLTGSEVQTIMKNSADDYGTPGYDEEFGWGVPNAFHALLDTLEDKLTLTSNSNSFQAGDSFFMSVVGGEPGAGSLIFLTNVNGDSTNLLAFTIFFDEFGVATLPALTWPGSPELVGATLEFSAYARVDGKITLSNTVSIAGE